MYNGKTFMFMFKRLKVTPFSQMFSAKVICKLSSMRFV